MTRLLSSSLSLSLLLVACTANIPGQTAGTDYVPKAGEMLTTTLSVDGKDVRKVTYRFMEMEPALMTTKAAASSQTLLLIPDTVDVLDPTAAEAASPVTIVPEAEFRSFLENEWDPSIGGKDDPGVNAKEFLDFLDEVKVSPVLFLKLKKASGLSLEAFQAALRAFRSLEGPHNWQALEIFDRLLEEGQLTWKEVAETLQARNLTFADLTTRLANGGPDLHTVRGAWLASGKTLRDFLFAPEAFGTRSGPLAVAGLALDIAKFGWQVVKDSKPKTRLDGASTHVLHSSNKDPFQYGHAKNFQSREIRLVTKSLAGVTQCDTRFRVKGTYDATSPAIKGNYLPSVFVDFMSSYAIMTFSINGYASVSNIANMGPVETPNPQITVITHLEHAGLFRQYNESYAVTLQGAKGVVAE